jgi:alpha-galactosidase
MHFPDRQRSEARNQLLLNLARPEVSDYVFNVLDKLVSENDIAFLKWDYNRNWSEPGWPEAPDAKGSVGLVAQKEIYVRYVDNLYDILRRLRAKHPKLEIESCSGGGGRVDTGILQFTDEVWPSDNTDALDRLAIQDGYTHAYSPETMAAWVTDVPNFLDRRVIPLQFRFLTAMQGALGIGSNLTKWTPEETDAATQLVAFYKTVRTTVQHGNLYRLKSPVQSEDSQVEYVSQDGSQAVMFAYLHSQHYGLAQPLIPLRGLDAHANYRVTPLDKARYTGEETVSGAVLMGQGIALGLSGDYASTAVMLQRLP